MPDEAPRRQCRGGIHGTVLALLVLALLVLAFLVLALLVLAFLVLAFLVLGFRYPLSSST